MNYFLLGIYIFISLLLWFVTIVVNSTYTESVLIFKALSIFLLQPLFSDESLDYISNLLFHSEWLFTVLFLIGAVGMNYKNGLRYLPESTIIFYPEKMKKKNGIVKTKEKTEFMDLKTNMKLRFCHVEPHYKKFLTTYNRYATAFTDDVILSETDWFYYRYYKNLLFWYNSLRYFKLI